jgi:hypothetical protein
MKVNGKYDQKAFSSGLCEVPQITADDQIIDLPEVIYLSKNG